MLALRVIMGSQATCDPMIPPATLAAHALLSQGVPGLQNARSFVADDRKAAMLRGHMWAAYSSDVVEVMRATSRS